MRPPHTQLNESFRLQFPFVFRQPQSLQLLLLARPCLSTFSGLPLSRPIAASASLSDPRCFRSLSVASASLPATQPPASSFLPSGRSASQLALRPGSVPYVPFALSPSSTAGFPSASFRFRILSFLFVSFRPSLLRSHSRSTGASLLGFPSGIGA